MDEFVIRKKSETDIVISLAGNPNVGKSSIFNELTGLRQHTGNWPGKTVGLAQGTAQLDGHHFVLVDLPGTYSLAAHSQEEEVARDFIQSEISQGTLVVCDATSLERNLNLVLQIIQLTPRVVVAVNLMDEAKKKKIDIDLEKLEVLLGVPVVGTSATQKAGLNELMEKVFEASQGKTAPNPCLLKRLKCLGQESVAQVEGILKIAESISRETVTFHNADYDRFERKLDKILTQKVTGIPVMVLLLFMIFWFTIAGADGPSDFLADIFGSLGDVLRNGFSLLGWPIFIERLLFDGIYDVLSTVVAVMLPPMGIFFPIFTLLEDFGYLPRVAFNLDKFYQKAGTCGKQALTMCMGFGCNAAGVVGARIIDSPRERIIAIVTNNFVPCNGRFPILISVITIFFVTQGTSLMASLGSTVFLTLIIILGIMSTFWISRLLSSTLLKGMPSSFALELPPYRRPLIKQVLIRSLLDRTLFVLGRAVAVAAPAGIVIFVLANIMVGDLSLFAHLTGFLDPFAQLMGLDGTILLAFILGLPANEIVIPIMIMGYMNLGAMMELSSLSDMRELLLSHGWTWLTAANVILFTLYHWPCSTTLISIYKETKSVKWTWISFLIPTVMGVGVTMLTTFLFGRFL